MMYPQVFMIKFKTVKELNKKLEEIVMWNPQYNSVLNIQYPSKNTAMVLARVKVGDEVN